MEKRYDHKTLGTFLTKQDCIEFATYYWKHGEVLDTRKNRLFYKEDGLPVGVSRSGRGYKVTFKGKYVKQFNDVFGAISCLLSLRKSDGK